MSCGKKQTTNGLAHVVSENEEAVGTKQVIAQQESVVGGPKAKVYSNSTGLS